MSFARTLGAVAAALALALTLGGTGPAAGEGAATRAETPACTNADLAVGYHVTGAATSHRYGNMRIKNTSGHDCRTGGFGGISYVGGGDGSQIGASADRTRPRHWRSYVLEPGQRLISRVVEVSASPYPKKKCRPAHVDGFRVYVPNATKAQYVAHPTTGCRNHAIHLLSHASYRRP